MRKIIRWNAEKSLQLRRLYERGNIGFEECASLIEAGKILDVIDNPSQHHSEQKVFVLEIDNYAYLVPYVENDEEIFLKTLYPCRKNTAHYLKER
ncbi:MAG: toxin [Alphaproteobacteria bacterium]|nr:toxin [Alphaproteobacteria bacterium]